MFVRGPLLGALIVTFAAACGSPAESGDDVDAGGDPDAGPDAADPDAGETSPCGTPSECAATWEDNAADRFDDLLGDPTGLAGFLKAVPKGADLHNHLNGAVYAETYLDWAADGGNCINSSSYSAVAGSACSATNQAAPTMGSFYDAIIRAWSMKDFVPGGTQTGRDHFFATFGKYGVIAGNHRDESIADILVRAADENQVYVETMFNLGKNVGELAATVWSGTLTADDLPAFYDALIASPSFASELANDVGVIDDAEAGYWNALGCSEDGAPAACQVGVRFIAQVSRTGANDQIFGQLVSAYEMAAQTSQLVGANLSSPEDDSRSLSNYDLHMAMLDFLHDKYTATAESPLHITLHAGEVTPAYLPQGSNHNTFHIRAAVETGHAERIGHGLDVMSETDAEGLLDLMAERNVLVEVCLSSNDQILEVSGTDHPLAAYLAHGVPVALATDDQGVSRSSMAGEYLRAALDQDLDYRQLKQLARNSLEHAFVPGPSLWTSITEATPVAACAPTATMGLGDPPSPACQAFLHDSVRAKFQWELERRFLAFESAQPVATP